MNLTEIIRLFVPALLTILGNVIFYLFVKNKVDASLEQFRISYSGTFKEKIEIYKTLLQMSYDLKQKIKNFQYVEIENSRLVSDEIHGLFNSFIRYYTINKPFLNNNVSENIVNIKSEMKMCFDDINKMLYYIENKDKENLDSKKYILEYFKAGRKLISTDPDSTLNILEGNLTIAIEKELSGLER